MLDVDAVNRHTTRKLTVIVPIYNVEKYLRKCLDSICGQTYKNLEIVLVNDCSPDNSYDICLEYAGKDDRIKIINKEKNEGLGAARMSGINAASGDYIGFVDSDDWILPCMYEDLMRIIEENNSDIVQCKIFLAYDNRILQSKDTNSIKHYNNIEAVKSLLSLDLLTPVFWNKVFKKDLYDVVSISTPRYAEDISTMYKLLFTAESIACYDKSCYYFRQHRESFGANPLSTEYSQFMIKIEKDRIKYFEEKCPELVINCKQKLFTKYASIHFMLDSNNSENKKFSEEIVGEMRNLYRQIKTSLSFKTRCIYFIVLFALRQNIISKCFYFIIKAILKKNDFHYTLIKRSWHEVK